MHKHRLRALGVSLMAALGLMAFVAVAAQAENLSDGGKAGKFLIEGSGTLVKGATFTGAQVGIGKLIIPKKNAYVECKKGKVTTGTGISETEVLAVVRFEECKTFELSTGNALTFCPVLGEPSKETIDATAIALPKLHESKLFILFEPEVGKLFAEIKFGAECGIGVKVKIGGTGVVAEVDNGLSQNIHTITFSEAIQRLFQKRNAKDEFEAGDQLLYGAVEAFLVGSATVELAGTHINRPWSVV